jgi:hypothetical protein
VGDARPSLQVRLLAWAVPPCLAVFGPLVGAFVEQHWGDFGRSVEAEYYGALAGIIPALLIALMIEMATVPSGGHAAREDRSESGSKKRREFNLYARAIVTSFFGAALVGEAAALGALGWGESTTFLCVTAGWSTFTLGLLLFAAYRVRWEDEPERPEPSPRWEDDPERPELAARD